jgi:hypothetical protein
MGPIYMKIVTIKSCNMSSKKKNHFKSCQQPLSQIIVLRYCSPMEIQHAIQEPQNAIADILAVVVVVDASDHRPYYPDEIRKVALIDDSMFQSWCLMDTTMHIFSALVELVLCAVAWTFFI